jgi:hypothetical protein
MTIASIFKESRAARMIEYHSRDKKYPGFAEVIDKVLNSSWKSTHQSAYYAEIQRRVNQVVLNQLIGLAADKNASPQVRALALLKLDELKNWLNSERKSTGDENQKAHFLFGEKMIEQFQWNPESFVPPAPLAVPPGAPIGG